jgi:hypothetical protein
MRMIKSYQRLPYIAKLIFQEQTAYEIGKEIYRKKLTGISKYSYCSNHISMGISIFQNQTF